MRLTRFEEARRRVAAEREERRLDAVEDERAYLDWARQRYLHEPVRVLDLMGSEDVEPGLERGDGFFVAHEVVVTEPWRPSLVRLDERPRVRGAVEDRRCHRCGRKFRGVAQARFCSEERCLRRRAAERAKRYRKARRAR